MNIYLQIFSTFSKIGAFTIGGGYAMLPLIQREVVTNKKWLSEEDFIDVLAISQSTPGVFVINISVFIGLRIKGIKGSIVAALGSALPSFVIILLIAMFFNSFKNNEIVEKIFKGMRPAVVALIAVPLIGMSKNMNINRYTAFIPVITVMLIVFFQISPIYILIAGAIFGIFYPYLFKK
ncbi:MAG: chromate transporter [Rikenellaceae bacterium]|jgi:chromate transporter